VSNPIISVIVPVFNCAPCLVELTARLIKSLEAITEDFEIILINDSSQDEAWEVISRLTKTDNRIKGINLTRNFGQHNAISAGLDNCKGSWIVIMDCDLQDQPEEIEKLYYKAKEGFDIVLGRRQQRKDSFLKKISNKTFYSIFNYLTESNLDPGVGTFRLISFKVVGKYRLLNERIFFLGPMLDWFGFRVATIDISHYERKHGVSSYGSKKSLHLALDGIISFSDKPLRFIIKFGLGLFIISILSAIVIFLKKSHGGSVDIGISSVIVFMIFSTGLIITSIGLVGVYIGGIFREVKQRPRYIIYESINFEWQQSKS